MEATKLTDMQVETEPLDERKPLGIFMRFLSTLKQPGAILGLPSIIVLFVLFIIPLVVKNK